VAFAERVLGADLWPMQRDILRSVAAAPRTAVKACHSSSKSFTAAAAALWWLARWDDGIVITTAPTWTQVEKILWVEIHRMLAAAAARGVGFPPANQTELRLGPRNYAMGLSTNEGVRFQGFHSGHLLVVIDEACGVEADIWESVESIRAGGDVRVLALSNPIVPSGPFYDAFTTGRERWATFTIDAFVTPNLEGLDVGALARMGDDELARNVRPYLVTRAWVREKAAEWGAESGAWQARVRGEFPTQAEDSLFPLALLEQARARPLGGGDGGLVAGIDVAGPGDAETVICVRCGADILAMDALTQADPRGACVALLSPYRPRLRAVNVDAIGIGYNFGLHLQDLGFPVVMVNVGLPSGSSERFANLKAQYYWGLRERLQAGDLNGLTDDVAIAQLGSIRYKPTPRGQIAIESKDELARRGVRSPDRAEALMLAFAEPSGPGAFLTYLRTQTEAPATPEPPEPTEPLPWAREPRVTVAAGSLQADYERVVAGAGASSERVCAACGRPIERAASYRSDGVSAWHPNCR
jgi:hypothetical protein